MWNFLQRKRYAPPSPFCLFFLTDLESMCSRHIWSQRLRQHHWRQHSRPHTLLRSYQQLIDTGKEKSVFLKGVLFPILQWWLYTLAHMDNTIRISRLSKNKIKQTKINQEKVRKGSSWKYGVGKKTLFGGIQGIWRKKMGVDMMIFCCTHVWNYQK